jgi:hypothetical protein
MFNFENVSKNKMRWITIAAYVTYFLIAIFAPVLTICIKFGLFSAPNSGGGVSTKIAISGWAAVLIIIVAVVGITLLKKAIAKIPDVKIGMARFKYTLQTVSSCVVPLAAFYVIHLFQTNLDLACDTGYWIAVWFLIAALFDGIIISGIDRENRFRQKAAEKVEIEKRADKV